MSWGEFRWTDLHPERRRDRRPERPRVAWVPGDPVPWMGFREDIWASKVRRALPHPLNRPFLTFVLRVVRDSIADEATEVRVWQIDG